MQYFAYASNMNRQQLEKRLQRVGVAGIVGKLDGYRLRFNKKSAVNHSGKANLVPDKRETVWGVVFDLSKDEFERIADFEHGYTGETIVVSCPGNKNLISAQTFIADSKGPDLLPTPGYMQTVLEGAHQHGLPEDYCRWLADLKTHI